LSAGASNGNTSIAPSTASMRRKAVLKLLNDPDAQLGSHNDAGAKFRFADALKMFRTLPFGCRTRWEMMFESSR
jgi:hypothetical protein